MSTNLNFKNCIDKPGWRGLAVKPSTHAAGVYAAYDLRNSVDRDPYQWFLSSTTTLEKYNPHNDGWSVTPAFTALAGTVVAGAGCVFVPTMGPNGTVGASPATTNITLAALPNSGTVVANQLANNGDGVGFRIKIHDVGAAGSGLTEERHIVANTSGATPIVYFDTPLSFTPCATAKYEVLSGSIFMVSVGTIAANFIKAFDIATGTVASIGFTNFLATTATDIAFLMMDERYVPYNRKPGEGMLVGAATYDGGEKGCLTATAVANGSITGQATGGDASVLQNEYRNFQIHIVEDAATPAAVGQRRKITSHTAGASPEYTLATNWTTNPSADAKFVIELNNDLLVWASTSQVTYSYAAGGFNGTPGNWSTAAASGGATQYANPGTAPGAGSMAEMAFSIVPEANKQTRQSMIYKFRGAASVTLECLDIAAGANGVWTTIVPGNALGTTLSTASCSAHDPIGNEGRWMYFLAAISGRVFRLDMLNRVIEEWVYQPWADSTAVVGCRLSTHHYKDGATNVGILYRLRSSGTELFDCILQR